MWKKLSIDKKFSNKYFVDTIMQKIRSIIAEPFTLEDLKDAINCEENKEILARCEHNSSDNIEQEECKGVDDPHAWNVKPPRLTYMSLYYEIGLT